MTKVRGRKRTAFCFSFLQWEQTAFITEVPKIRFQQAIPNKRQKQRRTLLQADLTFCSVSVVSLASLHTILSYSQQDSSVSHFVQSLPPASRLQACTPTRAPPSAFAVRRRWKSVQIAQKHAHSEARRLFCQSR